MAFADDPRLFVRRTISGRVNIVSSAGEIRDEVPFGGHTTSCIFGGSKLYVNATEVPDLDARRRTATSGRAQTGATGPSGRPARP